MLTLRNKQMWEALKAQDPILLEEALRAGADPNAREQNPVNQAQWDIPLIQVIHAVNGDGRHLVLTKLLLDAGADIEQSDQFKYTALHHAASWGYHDLVKYLLERGANPNACAEANTTPLMLAAMEEHLESIEILLRSGADPTMVDDEGETALSLSGHEYCDAPLKIAMERRQLEEVAKSIDASDQHEQAVDILPMPF